MKIVSWNVNGIRSAYKKGFFKYLKNDKPDILCLQEIKSCAEQVPVEILNNARYQIYINSAEKKGYSGTAILTKQNPLKINFHSKFKQFDSEGRFIELIFSNFILINLYIPHGSRDKSKLDYKIKCYGHLLNYIKHIKNKKVILVGDFNIAHNELDLARPKNNKKNIMFTAEERSQIDNLLQLGFSDTFRLFNDHGENYTWWPYLANARERNIGWRIDYIFASKNLIHKIKKSFILNKVKGSDHCPVGLEIQM